MQAASSSMAADALTFTPATVFKPRAVIAAPTTSPAPILAAAAPSSGKRRSHCDDEMFNIHGAFMMGSHFASMTPPDNSSENSAAVTMAQAVSAPVEKLSGKKRPHCAVEPDACGTADKESIRRQKHKEVEIRRRQRISSLFDELKDMLQCSATDRSSILQCCLEKLKCVEAMQTGPAIPEGVAACDEQQCAVALEQLQALKPNASSCESLLDHYAILKELPTPVIICKASQEVLFVNNTFTRQFGFTMDNFKNAKPLFDVLSPCCNTRQLFGQCCEGMVDMFRVNSEINLKGDGRRAVRIIGGMNFSKGTSMHMTLMFERP
jgi:hypothetical protein